jgi:hypothetical protein
LSILVWSVVMTAENSTVVTCSVVNLTALLAHGIIMPLDDVYALGIQDDEVC